VKSQPAAETRSSRGAKRMLVLDEAAKALNRRGVSQTSLAEIAQSVGVSRAALYYYFEDQEDLVFQCYRRSCELMARSLNEAVGRGGDALAITEAFVDGMLGPAAPEFAALSEAAFLREEQRNTIFGLYEGLRASLADILEEGARRGELRTCGAGVVAQSIIGLISWIPMARRWRTSDPLSDADLVDAIKVVLRDGVAADRSAAVRYTPFDVSPTQLPVGRVFDTGAVAQARQEALLAAASWLFNLKGIDATSLEEIALRVGVTKKVIYHNVGDKQTLVVQCYRRSFQFYEEVARRMERYEGPRIDAVCACAHALAEASLREDVAPLAPLAGFEALPEAAREEIQASALRLMDMHLRAYATGKAEGSVRPLHARAVLAIHPGMWEWLPKWFEAFDSAERQAAARELTEFYRLGLRPI
jgi:AcrR family transcriptional regulator